MCMWIIEQALFVQNQIFRKVLIVVVPAKAPDSQTGYCMQVKYVF
jgi:hypothetical protein